MSTEASSIPNHFTILKPTESNLPNLIDFIILKSKTHLTCIQKSSKTKQDNTSNNFQEHTNYILKYQISQKDSISKIYIKD